MKIIFVSNYFNHHQKPLCDALYQSPDIEFSFISTTQMREERRKMGYDNIVEPEYVLHAHEDENTLKLAKKLILEAEAVICGFVPKSFLKNRIKKNKLIFYYCERPIKTKLSFAKKIKTIISWKLRIPNHKKIHLLCASAYSSLDFKQIGVFLENRKMKSFRWGYFPETKTEIDFSKKEPNLILWCGRLLSWKRPMDVLNAALILKKQGYNFKLKIIGDGEEKTKIQQFISENNLSENVELSHFIPPDKIRNEMEKASVYLFTSNKQEGWGAVLNESMNSGCAVIASHAAGSTNFLINNDVNGLIYESGNVAMLAENIKTLLDSPEKSKKLGENAYKTITEKWNSKIAAKRFIILAKTILNGNAYPDIFPDGPCSVAPIISDNWIE